MTLPYKHLIAIIYTIVLFLDRLDLTIVNVALPTVSRVFNVSIIDTDWVSLSFLLALAMSIPISGWLAQRFGPKKMFILAMLVFGFGSLLCAFASSLSDLIILRFIHGIGGGLLIPIGMTMLYKAYDKSEYASITSFTIIPALIAPSIAPFLGGLLLESLGWNAVFLFSGPICLILSIISIIYLKEETHHTKTPLDILGFIFSSATLITIFYVISELGKGRWSYILVATMIFFIGAFIWAEKRAKVPLLDLRFFSNKIFVRVNAVQLCFQICHLGSIFLVGMYLQIGIGLAPSLAGLIMGMQAVGAIAISRYSVKLFNHYGPRLPISVGLLGLGALSPCILFITPHMILPALLLFFVRGIFSGLCGTPVQTLGVIGFSKHEVSSANTIFNASRQVSISVGVAVSSLFMGWGLQLSGLNGTEAIPSDKLFIIFGPGFLVIPLIACIGALIMKSVKIDTRPSHLKKLSPSE